MRTRAIDLLASKLYLVESAAHFAGDEVASLVGGKMCLKMNTLLFAPAGGISQTEVL